MKKKVNTILINKTIIKIPTEKMSKEEDITSKKQKEGSQIEHKSSNVNHSFYFNIYFMNNNNIIG